MYAFMYVRYHGKCKLVANETMLLIIILVKNNNTGPNQKKKVISIPLRNYAFSQPNLKSKILYIQSFNI